MGLAPLIALLGTVTLFLIGQIATFWALRNLWRRREACQVPRSTALMTISAIMAADLVQVLIMVSFCNQICS